MKPCVHQLGHILLATCSFCLSHAGSGRLAVSCHAATPASALAQVLSYLSIVDSYCLEDDPILTQDDLDSAYEALKLREGVCAAVR